MDSTDVDGQLMHRGAEADLYSSTVGPWRSIVKVRVAKSYRQSDLDGWIRKERTIKEASLLSEARKAGVRAPTILAIELDDYSLTMSFIPGKPARDELDNMNVKSRTGLFEDFGRQIGLLHKRGIVHGDLTTSNLIVSEENTAFVVDFGLANYSTETEDRAVDLHLLRRSIATSHKINEPSCFKALSKGYTSSLGAKEASKVFKKSGEIARRGRYFAIR